MKKYFKTIIFSKSILKTSYRFEDEFQILPLDLKGKATTPLVSHFPLFLEYTIEFQNEKDARGSYHIERINKEKEIVNLLSCLTNYRFFRYEPANNVWGVDVTDLTELNSLEFDKKESRFFFSGYYYHERIKDLNIGQFTDYKSKAIFKEARRNEYYMDNPIDDKQYDITFPNTLNSALQAYYGLTEETRKKINSCIYLACDGMDISSQKRTLSFLSYISAIEGLVNIEISDKEIVFYCKSCKTIKSSPYTCPQCNRPIWGIKTKFVTFLSKYVAGSENAQKKFKKIYDLRCSFTHLGKLFASDYELCLNEDANTKDENDWLMRLETLQAFRISLNNWLLYSDKK